jgi:hypothetical protein
MAKPAAIRAARLVAIAAVLGSSSASAQDSAASEALFTKGVSEMEAGRWAAACPALEESQRLDPRPGTLFTLAECEAGWGKVASAVAHYSDYLGVVSRLPPADQARHRDREKTARSQLDRLRAQVPLLTVVVPASAPKGTVVKRDGVVLGEVSFGTGLPVDPGEHVLATQAPGGPYHEERVTLSRGERKRVEVVVVAARPGASSSRAPGASQSPTRVSSPPTSGGAPQQPDRTWAYVAGGVGVAGILTGAIVRV